MNMNQLTVETEDVFSSVLELAANNDMDGFRRWAQRDPSSIDETGSWYGRRKGSKQIVLEERTPMMVAATYGSINVLELILSLPGVNVNRSCGLDKSTALHCAATGGSVKAIDIVKLLLAAGADPNLTDANGHRPVDVIVVCPKFQEMKLSLEKLLSTDASLGENNLRVSTATSNSNSNSPPLSPSPGNGSPSSHSDSTSSPKISDLPVSSASEKREYPVDPSLPDIKNSIYSTDEFRMFSFKVRPCSRAYSHDWTECPFVHPGENARRRDPRKYHYSCVPCPDFRKGACRRGDMCEYAHGVFECWLHPAQYRTRLCKDGTSCNRRVCFFSHTQEELRPLYVSTGSAVPSPRSGSSNANAMEFAAMNFIPGSPSSVSMMSPSPFTPPMSPSANGISNMGWAQPNLPALHLPGSNLQSSRLRSSFNARDIPTEDLRMLSDIDVQQQQLLDEISRLCQPNSNCGSLNHSARSKTLAPSNLEDLFSVESLSPRYSDQALASAVFSPTHKSAVFNQFQPQSSVLSPTNTSFSPKSVDHPLLQASFGVSSSGRMSPRSMDPISPMSSRALILGREQQQQQQQQQQHHQFRSLSSRDLGSSSAAVVGSPVDTWSNWGSSMGKPDWAVSTEFGKLKRSSSFELGNEEPDVSWVQSLVRESPQDMKEKSAQYVSGVAGGASTSTDGANVNPQIDQMDPLALSALLDQMQLDHLMAQ